MRPLFGIGAIGETIRQVQQTLTHSGFDTNGTDGWYGNDTAKAVQNFQTSKALPPTGSLDDVTWQSLMQGPIPSCALRSLQLTASFESHGFGLAMGNFDGALLTWGIIGFTLKHDKVSSIVLAVNDSFPERIQEAFGASASELLSLMRASKAEQESWADEHTLSNGRLAEPWKKMFATFGSFPEVQQEQLKRVQSDYMQPAIKTAKRLGFKSELGLALCFDIHVQNGGIKKAAMEQVRSQSSSNQRESDLRQVVANAVANAAGQKYREDVRRRKLTVARGTGRVHGHDYVLANWGINEQFVADEVGA